MTKETQNPSASTSSSQTDALPQFDQIRTLGQKLVDELGLESSTDTLGRWMAHYISSLINDAENAPIIEKAAAQKKCYEGILELWSHRAELPDGKRPFQNLEHILSVIETLDPDDETPRFFRSVRGSIVTNEETIETQELLEIVRAIDETAKILIRYYLAKAAHSVPDREKEWVKLAQHAGVDQAVTDLIINIVSPNEILDSVDAPQILHQKLIRERLRRLETFSQVAAIVSENLKSELMTLP